MNIIKNAFYAVCPLHSDIKRDDNGELTVKKNRGFVWTKRSIALGLFALGFALLAITALSAGGVLPIGMTGQAILCGSAIGVSALVLLYQIGLGIGGIRSNKKILQIEKARVAEERREGEQVVEEIHEEEQSKEENIAEESSKQDIPPMYSAYGQAKVNDTYAMY